MTDTVTVLPSFITQVLTALARHGLTALSGFLLADGLLQNNQTDQFINIGVSLIVGIVGLGWSYWQKRHARGVLVAAINAPAALPPMPIRL